MYDQGSTHMHDIDGVMDGTEDGIGFCIGFW